MIVYLHPCQQPITPPWLDDYALESGSTIGVCRRDTPLGHLVGIGEAIIFDLPPERAFTEIADGWRVALIGKPESIYLARRSGWCETKIAESLTGEQWAVPIVLDAEGRRAFQVSYGGRDFLPVLTEEQQRCKDVAEAARAALLTDGSVDMPIACRWAAALLSAANHIAPEVLAALALIDDRLAVEVLTIATGLPLKKAE